MPDVDVAVAGDRGVARQVAARHAGDPSHALHRSDRRDGDAIVPVRAIEVPRGAAVHLSEVTLSGSGKAAIETRAQAEALSGREFESQTRIRTRIRTHAFMRALPALRVGVSLLNESPIPPEIPPRSGGSPWTSMDVSGSWWKN